jgi:CubicO group peptidase (beta-lactamase class C family)
MRLVWLLMLFIALHVNADTWPDEQWPVEPHKQTVALDALEDYAFPARDNDTREGVRTDALLVIRDGKIVYERYAAATTAQTPHLTWSISKSIMMGVAFGEQTFQLDDPVAKFYPPFSAHPEVTLRHLLNWTSGLDWQEDYEYAPLNSSVVAMLYTRGRDDMARFTADHGRAQPPGTSFLYSSGDSNVLSAALKGIVGTVAYSDYPWTALFEPLGIRNAVWEADASGTYVASSYVYMTARDLARIGLLMQRGGRWQGKQMLPAGWVSFALTPVRAGQIKPDVETPGGQWWLNRAAQGAPGPWPHAPADTFAALGHWGQALYVVPSEHLVIVRYADDRDGSYVHDQLLRLVLAAFAERGAK